MAALGKKLRTMEGGILSFQCPGCEELHGVTVTGDHPVWGWNGSADFPTFTPSILVRSGHYAPNGVSKECWCTYDAAHPDTPSGFKCKVCHSFVAEGKIQFLSDCTHALKGMTADIPDWEEG